jgi:hypothetical protein
MFLIEHVHGNDRVGMQVCAFLLKSELSDEKVSQNCRKLILFTG